MPGGGGGGGAGDDVFEAFEGGDAGFLGRFDFDGCAGGRVASHAGLGLDLGEFGEAAEHDGVAFGDGGAHDVGEAPQDGVDGFRFGVGVGATAAMSSRRFMGVSFEADVTVARVAVGGRPMGTRSGA